jgi:glycosyltransferase involved in cell wall biosynthesis
MIDRATALAKLFRGVGMASARQPTLLVLSQVYVPDPAAVGQYMHDVAVAMTRRGTRVIVLTADAGYEEPDQHYRRYEQIDGVHVVRLPWSSFGKSSLALRLVGGGIFTCEAAWLGASLPRVDRVLVSTSPPMCALAGIGISRLRGAPLSFWAMDINPDQIVSTGRFARDAWAVRGFERLNRLTLEHAEQVITLDPSMAERLRAKRDVRHKLRISPLWSLVASDEDGSLVASDAALATRRGLAFRRTHGFGDKRVVMYSGNLSQVHPIDTLLDAVRTLRADPRLMFVFIGGGTERARLGRYAREHALPNLRLLPYQPREALAESLAAADLHLVAMGDAMVGIVHPSKIYSALAVGRPVLALGPRHSHVAELVHRHRLGWHVEHGDEPHAVRALQEFAALPPAELAALGKRAGETARSHFGRSRLLDQFCGWLETSPPAAAAPAETPS